METFVTRIEAANEWLNGIVWGAPAMILILGAGLLLSVLTRFPQFTHFGHALKNTIGRAFQKNTAAQRSISPFKAMCTALAASIGTGNIAGVSGAITIGGFHSTFGGPLPALIVAVCLSMLALSTILSWGLYGVRCWEFLAGPRVTKNFLAVFVVFVVIGSSIKLSLAWAIADTLNGLMAIPNLIALMLLSPVVARLTREYFSAHRKL